MGLGLSHGFDFAVVDDLLDQKREAEEKEEEAARAQERAQEVARADLTERETVILAGVARGLSNRTLGKELWVTEQTVKFHLTNIYRKLGVANRTEATHAAYRLGIVESPMGATG